MKTLTCRVYLLFKFALEKRRSEAQHVAYARPAKTFSCVLVYKPSARLAVFDNVEISSALTLTKGWTESKTAAMSAPAAKVESGAQTKVLSESAGTIPMFRKTPFKGLTDYKKVSCKVVDKEQFINNIENSRNSR